MRPHRNRIIRFGAGMLFGMPNGLPSYNAICSICESMFRTPMIKPRSGGPVCCPDCIVYYAGRNWDQDLDPEMKRTKKAEQAGHRQAGQAVDRYAGKQEKKARGDLR